MRFLTICKLITACALIIVLHSSLSAQTHQDSILTNLTQLRDDYINKIKAAGYKPSLSPPQIVLDNPPSFGNYDEHNIIHMSDWSLLPAEHKAAFQQGADRLGNGMTGEQYFNMAVYKWIFIHELSHWWRSCQKQTAKPYDEEKDANRLASAYWNERDNGFYQLILAVFQNVLDHYPNPVPAGQPKEQYFNDNYNNLPGGAAYSWYQSVMIIEVSKETPHETFNQAVTLAGNPLKE